MGNPTNLSPRELKAAEIYVGELKLAWSEEESKKQPNKHEEWKEFERLMPKMIKGHGIWNVFVLMQQEHKDIVDEICCDDDGDFQHQADAKLQADTLKALKGAGESAHRQIKVLGQLMDYICAVMRDEALLLEFFQSEAYEDVFHILDIAEKSKLGRELYLKDLIRRLELIEVK